jgi:hypothetical protein
MRPVTVFPQMRLQEYCNLSDVCNNERRVASFLYLKVDIMSRMTLPEGYDGIHKKERKKNNRRRKNIFNTVCPTDTGSVAMLVQKGLGAPNCIHIKSHF